MKRLDRFILKAFIGPFIMILLVVVFILMMQFLWLYIDELVGKGLSLGVILEFLGWGICTILPLALPLSTLLASMMTLGSMGENNELMAIKAAGVSLLRVMAPISIASLAICVAAFFAGNDLVPKAYNEIYTLRDDIGRTKEEIKIPSGTFYDGIEGYVLRVDSQNKKTGMLYGVMVYDQTSGKGNVSVTIADSSAMRMSKNKDYLTFTLYSGINYQETNTKKYRDTTLELQKIEFERQDLIISLKNYAFEKSDDNRFGNQVKTKKLADLRINQDSLRTLTSESHDRHYNQLRISSSFVLHNQLDTSRVSDARVVFESDDYMKWKSLHDELDAYSRARDKAERMSSEIAGFTHEEYEHYFYLRRTDVALLQKFSQAIACFVMFLIGAPLGALIGKGGIGTSAIVSALFFVLYWVIDISGVKLANDGAVNAAAGVFISTYILLPIGIYLTWKAVHDSTFVTMDSFKTAWRKVRSRIVGFFRKPRIVYMGTPDFAVAPLDALIRNKYKVVGVVTVADKPAGRGLKVNESAVKKYAVAHGIPVLQPLKLKDPEFLAQLKAFKADMFVVVAFRMLPEEVWSMPKLGTFNLHAALLPQYRGAAPINWAVINGEKITGVTTFMIDKDIDTGGIILRQECRISETDTAGDVHDRLMEIGSELVVQTVEGIIQHTVETRVQRSFIQGSEVLKPAPKLTRETMHIDWNRPTVAVYNLIRGLSPYPAAYTEITKSDGTVLEMKIFSSEKMSLEQTLALSGTSQLPAPGTILTDGSKVFAFTTADGAISVRELQVSGKKKMDVKAFLLGWRA